MFERLVPKFCQFNRLGLGGSGARSFQGTLS